MLSRYQSYHDSTQPGHLHPRARDRVTVTMITRVTGAAVALLLNEAFGVVVDQMEQMHRDTLLPKNHDGDPAFVFRGREGFIFEAWNDHDMTFGALKEALIATYVYMHNHGWGEAFITIWDNDLQVGEGRILG